MPATLNIQNTLNWCRPLLKNQPLEVTNFEPAMTTANMILQTMVGAPFRWPFNRGVFTLPLSVDTYDYTKIVADYGFMENVTITSNDTNETMPLAVEKSLPKPATMKSRPTAMAVQQNFGNTQLGIRLKERPEKSYTLEGIYQKSAMVLASPGSYWFPVTDEFSMIFNWGFLTMISLLVDDMRFTTFEKFFIGRLLGTQDGLDAQTRNIFLGNWLELTRTISRSGELVNNGSIGRRA